MSDRFAATFTDLRGLSDSTHVWLIRRIVWFAIAVTCVLSAADPDLWGHLRFGLDIVRQRSVSGLESYSYTSDLPLTNHEWLAEAMMAIAYTLAGVPGLVALKTLVVGTVYALIARAYRTGPSPFGEATALVAAILCLPLTITIRPQIWSFLFVAVLCRIDLSGIKQLVIPLLFLLWANLHGGWIVGIALLAWRCAGEMWRRRRLDFQPIALVAASLAATLINPYGAGLWRFMTSTVRPARADITEWQPIWAGDSTLNLIGWLLAATLVVACAKRIITRRPETVIALAGLGFAAMRVQRLVPLFIVASLLLLAPAGMRPLGVAMPASPGTTTARRIIDSVLLAGIVAFSTYLLSPRLGCIAAEPLRTRPDGIAAATLTNPALRGRLAVEFDWGEYAIWHFGPRLRVSVDGRRETIYSDDVLREQRELAEGSARGLAVLDRDRPEYVWMRRTRSALLRALPAHSYRIDVLTDRSFVAVRKDLAALGSVAPTPSPCFPGL